MGEISNYHALLCCFCILKLSGLFNRLIKNQNLVKPLKGLRNSGDNFLRVCFVHGIGALILVDYLFRVIN